MMQPVRKLQRITTAAAAIISVSKLFWKVEFTIPDVITSSCLPYTGEETIFGKGLTPEEFFELFGYEP